MDAKILVVRMRFKAKIQRLFYSYCLRMLTCCSFFHFLLTCSTSAVPHPQPHGLGQYWNFMKQQFLYQAPICVTSPKFAIFQTVSSSISCRANSVRFQKNEVKNVSRIDCESCAGTLLNMSLGRRTQKFSSIVRQASSAGIRHHTRMIDCY